VEIHTTYHVSNISHSQHSSSTVDHCRELCECLIHVFVSCLRGKKLLVRPKCYFFYRKSCITCPNKTDGHGAY